MIKAFTNNLLLFNILILLMASCGTYMEPGTVWGLGMNQLGQLGIGATTYAYTFVQTPVLTDAIYITEGNSKFMAIRSDSTVWACGDNYYGNLGDGTNETRNTPVKVKNLSKIKTVSCRWDYYSAAIESNGVVWAWGKSGLVGSTKTPQRVEVK